MEFTLVLPDEANIEEGKISVLAPLGTAMLGYGVGDEFEWTVPYGARRLKVIKVHFQPEASAKNSSMRSDELNAAPSRRGYSTGKGKSGASKLALIGISSSLSELSFVLV